MVLNKDWLKLVVLDEESGEELVVITPELITTARDSIVVKLTPSRD